jgi:FMN reductase
MSRIVVLSGSPSPTSRSRRLAVDLQTRLAREFAAKTDIVDVGDLLPDLLVRSASEAGAPLRAAIASVQSADLLIAVSPIYKGSYTGLFKHFVDLIDYTSLVDMPVALLATGGSDRHALAVEHELRPLFAFFGAHTLPTGVFVPDAAIGPDGLTDAKIAQRLEKLADEARAVLRERAQIEAARSRKEPAWTR